MTDRPTDPAALEVAREWIETTLGPMYPDESWPYSLARALTRYRRDALIEAARRARKQIRRQCVQRGKCAGHSCAAHGEFTADWLRAMAGGE